MKPRQLQPTGQGTREERHAQDVNSRDLQGVLFSEVIISA